MKKIGQRGTQSWPHSQTCNICTFSYYYQNIHSDKKPSCDACRKICVPGKTCHINLSMKIRSTFFIVLFLFSNMSQAIKTRLYTTSVSRAFAQEKEGDSNSSSFIVSRMFKLQQSWLSKYKIKYNNSQYSRLPS